MSDDAIAARGNTTVEHRLTDAQIAILRIALGGRRPAFGQRAWAPIRACEALAALRMIERRAATPEAKSRAAAARVQAGSELGRQALAR